MKYDLAKTKLWECYKAVLDEWWVRDNPTQVQEVIFEAIEKVQVEFGLMSDYHTNRIVDLVEEVLSEKLSQAIIQDIEDVAVTGAGEVIDEVMEKNET